MTGPWLLLAVAYLVALAAWACLARHDRRARVRRAAARTGRLAEAAGIPVRRWTA
jgi:hypothetical protein